MPEEVPISMEEMSEDDVHEFAVLNITKTALPKDAKVTWERYLPNGDNKQETLDVGGLAPMQLSERKRIEPRRWYPDFWSYNIKKFEGQCRVYSNDRFILVIISDYGIGVSMTATSPCNWQV